MEFKNGYAVQIPKGTQIEYDGKEVRIRKSRIGAVEYVGQKDICLKDAKGKWIYMDPDTEVRVVEEDHRLNITKHNRGGSPIAGWNWPLWSYTYTCGCGENVYDRDGYADHLRSVLDETR